jgi:hypothetical protein
MVLVTKQGVSREVPEDKVSYWEKRGFVKVVDIEAVVIEIEVEAEKPTPKPKPKPKQTRKRKPKLD